MKSLLSQQLQHEEHTQNQNQNQHLIPPPLFHQPCLPSQSPQKTEGVICSNQYQEEIFYSGSSVHSEPIFIPLKKSFLLRSLGLAHSAPLPIPHIQGNSGCSGSTSSSNGYNNNNNNNNNYGCSDQEEVDEKENISWKKEIDDKKKTRTKVSYSLPTYEDEEDINEEIDNEIEKDINNNNNGHDVDNFNFFHQTSDKDLCSQTIQSSQVRGCSYFLPPHQLKAKERYSTDDRPTRKNLVGL